MATFFYVVADWVVPTTTKPADSVDVAVHINSKSFSGSHHKITIGMKKQVCYLAHFYNTSLLGSHVRRHYWCQLHRLQLMSVLQVCAD